MKAFPQAITSAMQLYFTGESLKNVRRFLKLQGVDVSHVAAYKWIKKYVALMEKYLDQITPQVSDVWRADELYVKIKGDMKYLLALMDDETRFWIAQEVADSKQNHDARKLLRVASVVAGKKPATFITDGLESYHKAYLKEWRTLRKDDCKAHTQHQVPRPTDKQQDGTIQRRDQGQGESCAWLEETRHTDLDRMPNLPQLRATTRGIELTNASRTMRNQSGRKEQVDNTNTKCECA